MTNVARWTSNAERITAYIADTAGGEVITLLTDGPGYGRVIVERPASESPVHPFVCWRWATHDTAGEPIRGGAIVWSGQYCETLVEATEALNTRGATS